MIYCILILLKADVLLKLAVFFTFSRGGTKSIVMQIFIAMLILYFSMPKY